MVVCAGVKSILDVPATLERLETLNIALLGYRTDAFPGFYLADSGYPVPARVESAADAAAILAARAAMGTEDFGILLANPISAADQLDPALHERTLADGLAAAAAAQVTGKDVTPFLLGYFNANTGGAALAANVALVLSNARLAGEVAVEYARSGGA
jgi:pseudouridine-5'-phosphate glycosidase